eukprot:SAG11_NODE_29071_length_314_cov_11.595349_1_plen_68_part_10
MSSPPRDFLSLGLSLAVTVHFGIPLGLDGRFFYLFIFEMVVSLFSLRLPARVLVSNYMSASCPACTWY